MRIGGHQEGCLGLSTSLSLFFRLMRRRIWVKGVDLGLSPSTWRSIPAPRPKTGFVINCHRFTSQTIAMIDHSHHQLCVHPQEGRSGWFWCWCWHFCHLLFVILQIKQYSSSLQPPAMCAPTRREVRLELWPRGQSSPAALATGIYMLSKYGKRRNGRTQAVASLISSLKELKSYTKLANHHSIVGRW